MSSAGLVSKQDLVERERTVFTTMKSHGHDEISSELMSEIMDYIPSNDFDYDDWIKIGMGLNDWGGANAMTLFYGTELPTRLILGIPQYPSPANLADAFKRS